jgi:hypothetical protein
MVRSGAVKLPGGLQVVDPDDLAERFWSLFTKRDKFDEVVSE